MLRLVVVAMLVACGSGGGDNPSASPSTDEAGKVREISGKVTATRGSETRTLATGTRISPDDVIDTGADGSVVIELAHNNALWSLEAGIKARVDQSVAWGLSKQVAAKPIEHATSSAGRHADRQGADTQVTASESAPRPSAAADLPEKPAAVATAKPAPRSATTPKIESKGTAPKPSGGCDEVGCVMNGDAACCAKYKRSVGAGAPADNKPSASLPESPDRTAIQSAMSVVKMKFRGCAEKGSAKGTLKITVKIGPDGKVVSANVMQPLDPAIDACVLDAIKKIELPRSQNGISFTYPIVIN